MARPRHFPPILLAVAFLAVGCASSDTGSPSAEGALRAAEPPTSIPFCDPPDFTVRTGNAELSEAELAHQNAALDAIAQLTATFGDRPEWTNVYYDSGPGTVVVQLRTDANDELLADIAALTDYDVRVSTVKYSEEEVLAAGERLHERMGHEFVDGSPLTGFGHSDRVKIDLFPVENAATLARDWNIPGPLDIYCINYEDAQSGNV